MRLAPIIQNIFYTIMTSKDSKPKEKAPELNWDHAIPMDPRDPRALPDAWPCFNRHNESVKGSNKFAAWFHCGTCGIRTNYVPRKGSPSTHQQSFDFKRVERALNMLQKDLKGGRPNMKLVTAAINHVTHLEIYQDMLQEPRPSSPPGTERSKTPMTPGMGSHQAMPTAYSPPQSTWTKISTPPSETRELPEQPLWTLLTPQEMEEIRKRAAAQTEVNPENPNQFGQDL